MGPDKESSEKDKGNDASSNPQQQPQKEGPQPRDDKAANPEPASSANSPLDWASALASVATVLKWIVFALLILAVIFFVLREGLKFLAHFTDWARDLLNALSRLWANLFQGRAREAKPEAGESGLAERRSR